MIFDPINVGRGEVLNTHVFILLWLGLADDPLLLLLGLLFRKTLFMKPLISFLKPKMISMLAGAILSGAFTAAPSMHSKVVCRLMRPHP